MAGNTGFQTTINLQPAPAVEGDFASANPYDSVLTGPGAFVAGPNGLTVGKFAWLDPTETLAANAPVTGSSVAPNGFVHRGSNAAQIITYLAETSMVVPSGMGVTLHEGGDFWARITTTAVTSLTTAVKAFASTTDGSLVGGGAAGATIAGAVETSWYIRSLGAVGELVKISRRAPF